MTYKAAPFSLEAFEYDPNGFKPEWFTAMVKAGDAYEYSPNGKKMFYYAEFGNKRGTYNAMIGDWICRDEFGHVFVWSASTFKSRVLRKEV